MLSDLKSRGEPGAVVYLVDCVELMRLMPAGSIDVIFADLPYRLSGGGVTVRSGGIAPVDKGEWDRSRGFRADHEFNVRWLRAARRVLKPDGTLWVSGTHHIIFSLGFALQSLDFRIIKTDGIQIKAPTHYNATSYTRYLMIGEDGGDATSFDRCSEDEEEHREDGQYSEGAWGEVEASRQDSQDPRNCQRTDASGSYGDYSS